MALLKKLIMAIFISITMLATVPAALAVEGGAPASKLSDVLSGMEEVIAAMKSGEAEDKVLALLKETKQHSKAIVISGPADMLKQKGSAKIKKSRRAYRTGEIEKAIGLAEEALEYYKKAKAKHFN